MLRRIACSMLVLCATTAHGQLGRQRPAYPAGPEYWVGLSLGYVDGTTTTDEASGSTWRFGYTSQIRATLEKSVSRGTTLGVAAGYSTAPLTYQSTGFSGGCAGGCQAKGDITQYMAFIRGGGGVGFHALYTLEAGVTRFSNFREKSTDSPLPPSNGSYDLTIGFGGGFAYGVSPLLDIYIGQMYDFVFHKQNSSSTVQSAPRLLMFRGGFRFGF